MSPDASMRDFGDVVVPSIDDFGGDSDTFLTNARTSAMEKVKRKQALVAKQTLQRRERAAANQRTDPKTPPRTGIEPREARKVSQYINHALPPHQSSAKFDGLQLVIAKVVVPGSAGFDATATASRNEKNPNDAVSNAPNTNNVSAVNLTQVEKIENGDKRDNIASCVVIGQFVWCGLNDGRIAAYPLTGPGEDSKNLKHPVAFAQTPSQFATPPGAARVVAVPGGGDAIGSVPPHIVVVYDSGAWARFDVFTAGDATTRAESELDAGCDGDGSAKIQFQLTSFQNPHPMFAETTNMLLRAQPRNTTHWSHAQPPRPPRLGAALLDLSPTGAYLYVASPVPRSNDLYKCFLPLNMAGREGTAVGTGRASASSKRPSTKMDTEKKSTLDDISDDDDDDDDFLQSSDDAFPELPGDTAPAATDANAGPFHPPFGRCERLEKHGDKVTCLVFYGDGLISGSNDKQLVLWRPSGCFQDTFQDIFKDTFQDTFQDTDSRVRVASIREEDENEKPSMASARSVRAPGGAIRALAISGDQNKLFTAGSDGAVRVWDISDVATKKEGFVLLRTFVGGHDGFCVSVSVVGNSHVVSGCEANPGGFWVKGDGAVKVWRVSDGRCVQTIGVPGHAGDVVAICEARTAGYEGNGVSTVLTASADGAVAHWAVKNGSKQNKTRSQNRNPDAHGGPPGFVWSKGFFASR